jgi:hypothetical protein
LEGGKRGLLDVVKQVLRYSVNTWDQGFMDKLYASTNAVSFINQFFFLRSCGGGEVGDLRVFEGLMADVIVGIGRCGVGTVARGAEYECKSFPNPSPLSFQSFPTVWKLS